MWNTFSSKILISVAGMIIMTALTIWYSAQRKSENTIHEIQEKNAWNLLNTVTAGIENEYKSIKFYRDKQIETRKLELENMVGIVIDFLQTVYNDIKTGKLSESQGYDIVLHAINNIRYDDDTGYFWIHKASMPFSRMIIHSAIPEYNGMYLYPNPYHFKNILGLREDLFLNMNKLCKKAGGGYLRYQWSKPSKNDSVTSNKISFVRLFKPWEWIVGSGLYVDDIEADVQARIKTIINELNHTFSEIKFDKYGYMFMFDGSRNILVHPKFAGKVFDDMKLPVEARNVFEQILKHPNQDSYIEYELWKPNGDKTLYKKKAYIKYFKPLDWYICVSYYQEDMIRPIKTLTAKLLNQTLLLVLAGLIVAFIMSRNIAAPLKRLVSAAELIDTKGIDATSIPITGSKETRELGLVLARAFDAIKTKDHILVASSNKLRITLDSIGDAVIATNLRGNITAMNKAAIELTHWNEDQAVGHQLHEAIKFINPDTEALIDDPVEKVRAYGQETHSAYNCLLFSPNPKRQLVNYSCTPIMSPDSTLMGAVLVIRDVTEQSVLEAELQQTQKMDSLGQLAGGIAHDFNNMLAGIMSAAELLDHKLPPNDNTYKKFVSLILSTCKKAAELTEKLLAFSRKGKIMSSPVNINTVINDAISILERSLNKRVEVCCFLKAQNNTVTGDPSQLQNMILNLAVNAERSMPNGGILIIATRNIQLDEDYCNNNTFTLSPGEYIEIKVEDNGEGISPAAISRIFEPFFSTGKSSQSSGLGLSAVYGSVKEHNGEILASSQTDEGTIFRIHLPVSLQNTGTVQRSNAEAIINGEGCILVIDDESIIRTVVGHSLEDLGYKVILAENGEDGLARYIENRDSIDLVILDMVMPQMDGRKCFKKLKEINPDVKVIMASGFMNTVSITEMLQEGILGFLQKPYRRHELSKLVSELI
jgi:PAS domain S-box-containing protein